MIQVLRLLGPASAKTPPSINGEGSAAMPGLALGAGSLQLRPAPGPPGCPTPIPVETQWLGPSVRALQ